MKQKLQNKKGLTLMEMLCTVAIVVIMSALLVTGMALASNTLAASVTASEARVLCDTLTTKLCYYIDRDGYNSEYITAVDAEGEEVSVGQCGELRWRENKLVPSKTYPSLAGAKVEIISAEEAGASAEDENLNLLYLKLSVCNRKTQSVYSYNIIEIQGTHASVSGESD